MNCLLLHTPVDLLIIAVYYIEYRFINVKMLRWLLIEYLYKYFLISTEEFVLCLASIQMLSGALRSSHSFQITPVSWFFN